MHIRWCFLHLNTTAAHPPQGSAERSPCDSPSNERHLNTLNSHTEDEWRECLPCHQIHFPYTFTNFPFHELRLWLGGRKQRRDARETRYSRSRGIIWMLVFQANLVM